MRQGTAGTSVQPLGCVSRVRPVSSTEMTSYQAGEVVDKNFESKHTVMAASSDLAKSLVILTGKSCDRTTGSRISCTKDIVGELLKQ